MPLTNSVADSADWELVAHATSMNEPGSEDAHAADLMKKARSEQFDAAWGDDWNPNPLSDVSE